MHKRLLLPVIMLLIGAGLLVAAMTASAAQSGTKSAGKAGVRGGTFVEEMSTDVDYTDPALDYLSTGWEIQYATACKLFNYPDRNGASGSELIPEVAAGFPRISNGGRTYTFTIRKGFRFSNGAPVTGQNFAAAFDRNADPKMQSPSLPFFQDIVGALAVNNGGASAPTHVAGVRASATKLVVTLLAPAPDFLARMGMPFFAAVPVNLARDPNGVDTPPSCGPYHIVSRNPNHSIVLKRNPFYKGSRPHNVNEIDVHIGNSLTVIEDNTVRGLTDYDAAGLPPTDYKPIADKYGVNRGQFWVKPELGVSYLAMNHDRPLFRGAGGVSLGKAVNYAVDRRAIIAAGGYLQGSPTAQILPPGIRGYRHLGIYPNQVTPGALKQALKLSKGHTGNGTAVLYTSNRGAAPIRAQIYQYDLGQIHLNVSVQQFARAVQIAKEGTQGAPFDLTTEGWIADYADPFDFINVLLDGSSIHASNNNNVAYFNSPVYNRKMKAAARLTGAARYTTYGTLDVDLMKNAAPWAPIFNFNDRLLVSKRTGCFTYNPVFSMDLAAVCLK